MSTITKTFKIDDVLTDMTSVVLSDSTGTYGVKRNDTDAVVVADGTAMTNSSTGVYTHTFTDPANDLVYTYAVEFVYDSVTYHVEDTITGPTTTTDLTSTANVKSYLGITSTDYDTIIGNLVTRASRAIETYCNRTFNSTSYSKERYPPGGNTLYVKNYPIISLSRVSSGRRSVLNITHSDSGAVSATVSVSSTLITLTTHGGSNDGDQTAAFGTYTTMSSLATQISTLTGWTAATVSSDYDNMASTELIEIGSRECLNAMIGLDVPDKRLTNFHVDFEVGAVHYPAGYVGGWKEVFVDYVGGYATIPSDLEQIAINIVSDIYNAKTKDKTLLAEKIGDYQYNNSVTLLMTSTLTKHKDDLSLWKREVYV